MKITELTTDEFQMRIANLNQKDWKYLGDKPAILDFYATWCGPCKALAPTLESLASEFDGKIYFYKINIDQEPKLSTAYRIQSIPTLLFIPMQGIPEMRLGLMSKNELINIINQMLLPKVG